MNHEDYKEMLELAALDALDEAESRSLEKHLETCDECRAQLVELRGTLAALVYLTEPVEAPAELRARILNSTHAPASPSNLNATGDDNELDRATDDPSSATSNVASFLPSARRKWTNASLFGALVASVVFVALLTALILLWNRNREMQAELARLSRRNEEMQTELNRLSQRNDEMRTELARLSNPGNESQPQIDRPPDRNNVPQGETPDQRASREQTTNEPLVNEPSITESPVPVEPDTRVVALAGTDHAPQAHARLTYNSTSGVITLSVSGLPTAPVGKAYQLWYMVKGRPIPGGVFVTGPGGRAMLRGQIPAEARNATAFAVTLENQNGANKPTGEKYLLGAVS